MAPVVLTKPVARNRLHPAVAGVYAYEWDIEQHKFGGPTFGPPSLTPGKNRVGRKLKVLVAADRPEGIAAAVSLPEGEYELLWGPGRENLLNALGQEDFDIVLLQSQGLDSEILKMAQKLGVHGGAVPLIVVSSPVAGRLAATENTRPQRMIKQKAAGISHPGICRALQLIHSQYSRRLSVKQMAKAACMSRRHFFRMFREVVGVCPVEYLNRVRIEAAKEELRRQYSVAEAAFAAGFGSVSYFRRVFKRIEGVTPRVYRKRTREEKNGTIG